MTMTVEKLLDKYAGFTIALEAMEGKIPLLERKAQNAETIIKQMESSQDNAVTTLNKSREQLQRLEDLIETVSKLIATEKKYKKELEITEVRVKKLISDFEEGFEQKVASIKDGIVNANDLLTKIRNDTLNESDVQEQEEHNGDNENKGKISDIKTVVPTAVDNKYYYQRLINTSNNVTINNQDSLDNLIKLENYEETKRKIVRHKNHQGVLVDNTDRVEILANIENKVILLNRLNANEEKTLSQGGKFTSQFLVKLPDGKMHLIAYISYSIDKKQSRAFTNALRACKSEEEKELVKKTLDSGVTEYLKYLPLQGVSREFYKNFAKLCNLPFDDTTQFKQLIKLQ